MTALARSPQRAGVSVVARVEGPRQRSRNRACEAGRIGQPRIAETPRVSSIRATGQGLKAWQTTTRTLDRVNRLGSTVKVVAIDGTTGTEVAVMGPASAAQSDLERLALAKLKARLAKDS